MYFIDKGSNLIGKEVIFVQFGHYAEEMVIVTKDKGIFVFNKDENGIDVYSERMAKQTVYNSEYIRKELNDLGIITNEEMKEYEKELQEKIRKQREQFNKEQEEKDYKNYLKLKEKYEK